MQRPSHPSRSLVPVEPATVVEAMTGSAVVVPGTVGILAYTGKGTSLVEVHGEAEWMTERTP
jgi:hypothetical protein